MSTKKLRTPLIKPRTQGGTFYTFSSALEDIGLNINELRNKVALSHYVVLDIPAFNFEGMEQYGTEEDNYNQGDYKFAESFQNYALNMETVLRNQDTYNFSESLTVSERVFWKYMQTVGLMEFKEDSSVGSGYYVDDSSIVKGFGLISAGAQRTDAYGIYNETFVQIPSSYGKMKVLFKPVSDKNYHILDEDESYSASNSEGLIENLDETDYKDGVLYTGISATAQYDDMIDGVGSYNVSSKKDELCVEFSLDKLREYYGRETLTYDDMGIECIGIDPEEDSTSYKFNAILVYYSIYDSTGKNILATNLYGILILNSAILYQDINTVDLPEDFYIFPELEKKQTTTTVSGSSYAFRLNVKASSIYSGNVIVNDESTASYEMSTEFNDVLRNLSSAIQTLKSNANVISTIASDNKAIKNFAANAIDKVNDLEKDLQALKTGKSVNLVVNTLSSSSISTDKLYTSKDGVNIYNDDVKTPAGYIKNKKLYFNEIGSDKFSSNTAEINSASINNIKGVQGEVSFMDGNDICGKINTNGIFTNNGLYIKNNHGAPEGADISTDVEKLLKKINVKLDTERNYYLELPEIGVDGISDNMIKSLYEQGEGITSEGFNYYNLGNLIMLLLEGHKILSNKVDDIKSQLSTQ